MSDRCDDFVPMPPARCALKAGHEGGHISTEIPEPLLEVATSMISEAERFAGLARRAERARRRSLIFAGACFILALLNLLALFGWI